MRTSGLLSLPRWQCLPLQVWPHSAVLQHIIQDLLPLQPLAMVLMMAAYILYSGLLMHDVQWYWSLGCQYGCDQYEIKVCSSPSLAVTGCGH